MRPIIIGAALAALAFTPLTVQAKASAGSDKMKTCAASWKAMSAADKKKTTYKAYSSDCMKGGATAAATSTPSAPTPSKPTPTATTTPAAKPAPMTAAKPAPAKPTTTAAVTPAGAKPADATGVCKDGSYTKAKNHSGACSRHGGVDHWL